MGIKASKLDKLYQSIKILKFNTLCELSRLVMGLGEAHWCHQVRFINAEKCSVEVHTPHVQAVGLVMKH